MLKQNRTVIISRIFIYFIITAGAIATIFPFIWMIFTSLETPQNALTFRWVPSGFHWENYVKAWTKVPFPRYFFVTIVTSIATLAGVLFTTSIAAYAFANMEFKGREYIFMFLLSMMMVPQPVYLVPSYIILAELRWIDTFYALIVPWLTNIFTIFLLRQHFKSIPHSLYEAAIIDGCSRFGYLFRVILPLSKGVLVTVSIFSIIGSWNSYMWPLVVINSDHMRPLQVGLAKFSDQFGSQVTLQMAAAAFCILPLLILYFIAQKQIISSFARSGLKG